MKFCSYFAWRKVWIESDSSRVVKAFKNPDIILFCLRNRWQNCLQLGISYVFSHMFRNEVFLLKIWFSGCKIATMSQNRATMLH